MSHVDKLSRVEYFEIGEESSGELADRIRQSVNLLEDLSSFDGSHHKQYAIDQAIRLLLKDKYGRWKDARSDWDCGVAP